MSGKFWGNVIVSVVVFCCVAFGVSKISASPSGIAGALLPEVKVSDSTKELLHSVDLARSSVTVQEKGNIVDASFAIKNKGGHDIKNVSILCTLFDAAGKEQGRDKWVVFDTVKAEENGVFTFSDKMFINDNIVRSDCEIVSLQTVKAPLVTVHRATSGGHGAAAAHDSGHGSQH